MADRADRRHRRVAPGPRPGGGAPSELHRSDEFPYETPNGCVYNSGHYEAALERVLELIDYDGWRERQRAASGTGKRIGIGIGSTLDSGTSNFGQARIVNKTLPYSGNGEAAICKLDLQGEIGVALGSVPQGLGHETTTAQAVADVLGVSPDEVWVQAGADSARNAYVAFSGTYASQFAVTGIGAAIGVHPGRSPDPLSSRSGLESYQVSDSPEKNGGDADALGARISALIPDGGPRTLAEKAFKALHDAVVTGRLSPGERLPIEALAEALGMSPMPIREALRRLDAVGLVENLPHRGARVSELSLDDLGEVYDARLALEIPAIRGAATNLTEAQERHAAELLDRHAAALRRVDPAESLRTHTEFHLALYEAAGSRWLMRLIGPLWESAERYRVATLGRRRDYLSSRMDEHRRILAACRDHQPEVAEVELWNHLAVTANAVAGEMGGPVLYETRTLPASA